MRVLVLAVLALALASCTPPTAPTTEGDASTPGSTADASNDPLAIAAAPTISEQIGVPVSLVPRVSRVEGDWGWLIAQPWTPEGAAIDWSQTSYALQASEGVLDGAGTTYVLLKRENGAWRVIDSVVGPTDVAWGEWHQRHGAPQSIFVMPPA